MSGRIRSMEGDAGTGARRGAPGRPADDDRRDDRRGGGEGRLDHEPEAEAPGTKKVKAARPKAAPTKATRSGSVPTSRPGVMEPQDAPRPKATLPPGVRAPPTSRRRSHAGFGRSAGSCSASGA